MLVTLGTVFSDRAVLEEAVRAVASTGATVIATVGMALREASGPAAPLTSDGESIGESVHFVRFAPMERLLEGVDLVVSAGGAGTVLAAMSRGVPMVLWPQGADQPVNAARAQAAGVASVVDGAAGIPGAVTAALSDEGLRKAAATAAQQIAGLPTTDEALTEIVTLSTADGGRTRGADPRVGCSVPPGGTP